jgi:hypothetical protein
LIALFQIRLGGQDPEKGVIRDQVPEIEGLSRAAATAAGICAAMRFQASRAIASRRGASGHAGPGKLLRMPSIYYAE